MVISAFHFRRGRTGQQSQNSNSPKIFPFTSMNTIFAFGLLVRAAIDQLQTTQLIPLESGFIWPG